MLPSSLPSAATLTTTISQIAAKNPTVGIAVALGSIDASILSSQNFAGSNASLSALLGAQSPESDPTTQILNAVNAHLGQNFNVQA